MTYDPKTKFVNALQSQVSHREDPILLNIGYYKVHHEQPFRRVLHTLMK